MIEGKAKASINAHLDTITSGDYRIKLTANSTIVYTKNLADFNAVLRNLKSTRRLTIPIACAGKRNHDLVVRGLQEGKTMEAIQEDLVKHTNRIFRTKIRRMKGGRPKEITIVSKRNKIQTNTEQMVIESVLTRGKIGGIGVLNIETISAHYCS